MQNLINVINFIVSTGGMRLKSIVMQHPAILSTATIGSDEFRVQSTTNMQLLSILLTYPDRKT